MKYFFITLLVSFFMFYPPKPQPNPPPKGFVRVDGTQFQIDGKPYRFIGTNFWYGMHLGVPEKQARLLKELDQLQALGCNNLRIMVGSEGPEGEKLRVQPPLVTAPNEYDEKLLKGLDFLLVEMAKRKMYGVLVFGNFWHWSGGFAQYLSWETGKKIPYPNLTGDLSWAIYSKYTYGFYNNKAAIACFHNFIKKIVTRQNSITKKAYKDDPTIMSWQLANEPQCGFRIQPYRKWMLHTAKLIKSLDPNHLVSTGSEGMRSESGLGNRRKNFIKNHRNEYIDYLTAHIWIQNWGWYNPNRVQSLDTAKSKAIDYLDKHIEIAQELNMPLVLEEFGIARDAESYESTSPIHCRDSYYKLIFEYLEKNIQEGSPFQGLNFWAWAGTGRPSSPKSIYQPGDDLIGDPPHEYQGWYSVYDTDSSTHQLIRDFNDKIQL